MPAPSATAPIADVAVPLVALLQAPSTQLAPPASGTSLPRRSTLVGAAATASCPARPLRAARLPSPSARSTQRAAAAQPASKRKTARCFPAFPAVPREALLEIDIRDTDGPRRDSVVAAIREEAGRIAERRKVGLLLSGKPTQRGAGATQGAPIHPPSLTPRLSMHRPVRQPTNPNQTNERLSLFVCRSATASTPSTRTPPPPAATMWSPLCRRRSSERADGRRRTNLQRLPRPCCCSVPSPSNKRKLPSCAHPAVCPVSQHKSLSTTAVPPCPAAANSTSAASAWSAVPTTTPSSWRRHVCTACFLLLLLPLLGLPLSALLLRRRLLPPPAPLLLPQLPLPPFNCCCRRRNGRSRRYSAKTDPPIPPVRGSPPPACCLCARPS